MVTAKPKHEWENRRITLASQPWPDVGESNQLLLVNTAFCRFKLRVCVNCPMGQNWLTRSLPGEPVRRVTHGRSWQPSRWTWDVQNDGRERTSENLFRTRFSKLCEGETGRHPVTTFWPVITEILTMSRPEGSFLSDRVSRPEGSFLPDRKDRSYLFRKDRSYLIRFKIMTMINVHEGFVALAPPRKREGRKERVKRLLSKRHVFGRKAPQRVIIKSTAATVRFERHRSLERGGQ